MDSRAVRRRTEVLLDRVGLTDRADEPVERFSRGMKQRASRRFSAQVLPEVGLELLVGLGWFAVAAVSVDRLVSAGRRDGSLEYAG